MPARYSMRWPTKNNNFTFFCVRLSMASMQYRFDSFTRLSILFVLYEIDGLLAITSIFVCVAHISHFHIVYVHLLLFSFIILPQSLSLYRSPSILMWWFHPTSNAECGDYKIRAIDTDLDLNAENSPQIFDYVICFLHFHKKSLLNCASFRVVALICGLWNLFLSNIFDLDKLIHLTNGKKRRNETRKMERTFESNANASVMLSPETFAWTFIC